MSGLIYDSVRKLLAEQKPGWDYVFENEMPKINTNDNFVDHKILHVIRNLGFRVGEIGYLEKFGIFFFSHGGKSRMTKQPDSSIRYISDSSPATTSFVIDVSLFTEKKRQKIRKQTVNVLKEYSKPKETNNV